ncbi:hypothetical protein D3C79_770670 [compost metagenome]
MRSCVATPEIQLVAGRQGGVEVAVGPLAARGVLFAVPLTSQQALAIGVGAGVEARQQRATGNAQIGPCLPDPGHGGPQIMAALACLLDQLAQFSAVEGCPPLRRGRRAASRALPVGGRNDAAVQGGSSVAASAKQGQQR